MHHIKEWDVMTGFNSKRDAAANKLQDETDMLTIAYLDGYEKGKKAVLAQSAQKPSYWLGYGLQAHTEKPFDDATPLYTTPPQRKWVGLTDEEIAQGNKESWVNRQAFESAVWWAEAKLKEKNT